MLPRHVTSLAAIFVCNILLSQALSSPNAVLLKLLAAKQSHDRSQTSGLSPSSSSSFSSFLSDSFPSDLSANDVGSDLWLESAGSDPMRMRAGSSMTSAGSPAEEAKSGLGRAAAASKRFHPSAFFGSRGKRVLAALSRDAPLAKRFFHQGFVGSRGKRLLPAGLLAGERMSREGAGAEEEEEGEEGKRTSRRFDPRGWTSGSRSKRYLPGLEALFLSQMYQKLNAEKWKRQSLLGFHAARG